MALVEQYRDPDPDALKITATGHQWWWEFEYEGLGPDGGPLITANELHIPLGQQVSITLLSGDVIHSFWVPQLVGKADVLPGRITMLEPFMPKEIGVYYGQCAEFCGSAHALMRFRVIVEPLAKFEDWVAALQSAPSDPGSELANAGKSLFFGRATCWTCHAIAGTSAQGKTGPNLSRFGSRLTLAAGSLENNATNSAKWIYDLRSLKPIPDGPLAMPSFGELSNDDLRKLTIDEAAAIAAYLLEMKVE
jgi:cytochrome c oxidase subunit 2